MARLTIVIEVGDDTDPTLVDPEEVAEDITFIDPVQKTVEFDADRAAARLVSAEWS